MDGPGTVLHLEGQGTNLCLDGQNTVFGFGEQGALLIRDGSCSFAIKPFTMWLRSMNTDGWCSYTGLSERQQLLISFKRLKWQADL